MGYVPWLGLIDLKNKEQEPGVLAQNHCSDFIWKVRYDGITEGTEKRGY